MVRAYIYARTDEINVCDHKIYTGSSSSSITSSNNIGYIYTIGIEYDVELEQKQRSIHSFLKQQKLVLISLQTIKMKIKRKYKPNE